MRDHYDFSNGIKNPYADKLKKQITIRLDDQVIDYFKSMAEETGMPYQNIINYYLLDCVKEKRRLELVFGKQGRVRRIMRPRKKNISLMPKKVDGKKACFHSKIPRFS